MKKISFCFAAIGMMVSLVACEGGSGDYDASGVFETTEVTVSARGTGEIMRFDRHHPVASEEGGAAGESDGYGQPPLQC